MVSYHSVIFQLYSDGTDVLFPNLDLLPGTQHHGQLGVFHLPSIPWHRHRKMHNTWFCRYNFLDSDQLRVGCAMSFPLHCNGPSMLHNIGGNGISRPFIRRTLFSQLLSIEVLFTNGWILVIFHFRGFFPLDGDNFNVFGEHATTPITLFYVTAGVPTVSTMHYALLIWVLQTINKFNLILPFFLAPLMH